MCAFIYGILYLVVIILVTLRCDHLRYVYLSEFLRNFALGDVPVDLNHLVLLEVLVVVLVFERRQARRMAAQTRLAQEIPTELAHMSYVRVLVLRTVQLAITMLFVALSLGVLFLYA